jgi:hypothetical protein
MGRQWMGSHVLEFQEIQDTTDDATNRNAFAASQTAIKLSGARAYRSYADFGSPHVTPTSCSPESEASARPD